MLGMGRLTTRHNFVKDRCDDNVMVQAFVSLGALQRVVYLKIWTPRIHRFSIKLALREQVLIGFLNFWPPQITTGWSAWG